MRASAATRAINWIEKYCLVASGADKGKYVTLTAAERRTVHRLYDAPGGLEAVPISGPLAAYLTLFNVCGHAALSKGPAPKFDADIFTVWNVAGPDLRAVLRRDGERVVCPEFGTQSPSAA